MAIKYNPQQPSTGYDPADLTALRNSNLAAGMVNAPNVRGLHFDSAEDASVFFARELDYVKAHSYDRLYPELSSFSIFPQTHEVNEGAESITWYSYEKTGLAKIISNYATDLPRADVKGKPSTSYIKSIGDSYGYSVQEMRASLYSGKSLDTRKADSAHYAIKRQQNAIAFAGDAENNMLGILSENTDIPILVLEEGAAGSVAWKDKTADEILADVRAMYMYQAKLTMNVERADTLALPSDVYIDISQRRLPDTDKTVLTYILENAPYRTKENPTPLTIYPVPELMADSENTNPYGVNAGVLYKNDPEKFSIETPMDFIQHPLQTQNLEMIVPCEARSAGAIIYYPLSLLIVKNI